jgi:pimeloyl-ACP methyl ester carboxylesterase
MSPNFTAPSSHSYISQRLRLHYLDWGNHDKPPLVLVHGGRDHCRNWDWVARALRDDWHVIAPDLRGHGDSAWTRDGRYDMAGYIYDLAQLIDQQGLAPVTLVAHSLGGNIALRYTGIFPETVRRLVAIEGLGPAPRILAERAQVGPVRRMRDWIDEQRSLARRAPRRYATFAEALARMHAENSHLSEQQALHLTRHGLHQNEDGSYSWKFDNYVRSRPPVDLPEEQLQMLWGNIACPTLLVYGADSWASNPADDGRIKRFRHARVEVVQGAGHWVHHDRLEHFLALLDAFL